MMNQDFSSGAGAVGALAITIASLLLLVYWVAVSWRAMRALEHIAATLREAQRD